MRDINFAATISLKHEEEFDERLGWNFATIGHLNFPGCHIEHIYRQILTSYFSKVQSKRVQENAPSMLLKASLGLLDMMRDQITPSPTNFLQSINQRHLLYILKGIIDSPPTYYLDFNEVAVMWIHEVCRIVLDRFPDHT